MKRIALGISLVLTAVLAAGCEQLGSRAEEHAEQPASSAAPELPPLQQFEAQCTGEQLTPECRSLLTKIAEGSASEALPLLCRTVQNACADPSAPVCTAVVTALTASGDTVAVEALLGLEAPAPEETLATVDQKQLVNAMDTLCLPAPPAPGCAKLVELLAASGVDEAIEHQHRSTLRDLVASAAAKPEPEQVPFLQKSVPNGAASIPDLLALSARGALNERERSLIERTVHAYGPAARPHLVAAVKDRPMPVSLRAAHLGWDPAHLEHDDPELLEGPKRSVEVTDASDHIGTHVRIYHTDGSIREGILKRIDDDILYVETRIGGGVMTTQIKRSHVERIQF